MVQRLGAGQTVEATSRALRLPTVREQAGPLAEAALRDRLTHLAHLAHLAELLQAELDDREARRRERRVHEARFPRLKHLADFDLAAAPTVQTYHRWRNQYGGMKADDARRLRELERESARLKRIVADKELEIDALKEIAKGNW